MIEEQENFTLINKTKGKLPSLPFSDMKKAALGAKYDLTFAIVNEKKIQELNKQYRELDKPTDILSFPLDETQGEIYINLKYARRKAVEFERPFDNFIGFLFIHGLIHLKGYDHGSKMESEELKIRKKFGI